MPSSVVNRCRRRVFDGVMAYSLQIESRPMRLVSHINAVWLSQESARDRLLWNLAAPGCRERSDASRNQPCRDRRRPDFDRARVGQGGDGAGALGTAALLARACRNLSAIHHLDGRRSEGPEYGHERSKVCLLAAAARQGKPEAIWEGITSGVFQTFSSDHCPFRYDDPKGKLTPNSRTSFRWVPNGIPGVETRLPILFSEGGGGSVSKNSWNCSLPITPGYTAFTRARGRSAWASTPTSSCGITS